MSSGLDAVFVWAGPTGWALVAAAAPLGIFVTAIFAVAARSLRAVTTGGAVAGAAVTFLLWISWPGTFAVLLVVFLLTWSATRAGYVRKQRLAAAERHSGRSASQVVANLTVAAAAGVAATYLHQPLFMVGCAAALAEAAADTVSSEVGQALGSTPVLITTFRPVPVGTDGGITAGGTCAGIAAALLISGIAVLARVIAPETLPIVLIAGAAGMLFDSFLGATLERSEVLDNDSVNFSSTLFAAVVAILIARMW